MRVKERLNEFGLRRRIMEDEGNIIHRRDMFLREFAGLFKKVDEEIREIDKLIKLGRKRRVGREDLRRLLW